MPLLPPAPGTSRCEEALRLGREVVDDDEPVACSYEGGGASAMLCCCPKVTVTQRERKCRCCCCRWESDKREALLLSCDREARHRNKALLSLTVPSSGVGGGASL